MPRALARLSPEPGVSLGSSPAIWFPRWRMRFRETAIRQTKNWRVDSRAAGMRQAVENAAGKRGLPR
jgi:hypothetical protein